MPEPKFIDADGPEQGSQFVESEGPQQPMVSAQRKPTAWELFRSTPVVRGLSKLVEAPVQAGAKTIAPWLLEQSGLDPNTARTVAAAATEKYIDQPIRQRTIESQNLYGNTPGYGTTMALAKGAGLSVPMVLSGGAAAPAILGSNLLGAAAMGAGLGALEGAFEPAVTKSDQRDFWETKKRQVIEGGIGGTVGGAAGFIAPKLLRGTWNVIRGKTPDVTEVAGRATKPSGQAGEFGEAYQTDLLNQYQAARQRAGVPFQKIAEAGGKVDHASLLTGGTELQQALSKSGEIRRKEIVGQIEGILELAKEDGEAGTDWAKSLEIGRSINELRSQAIEAGDRGLDRYLKKLSELHQSDMDRSGSQYGELYKQAKDGWIKEVVPFESAEEGGRFLQNFMKNPTPNDAMRALTAVGPDKAKIFFDRSGPKGRAALQSAIVEEAFDQSMDPATSEFVPKRFLEAINKREAMYNLSFKGEEKWKMDAFKKLTKDAYFLQQLTLLPNIGIPASQVAQKLFTTKAGSRFLLGASSMNPATPKGQAWIDQMFRSIAQGGGTGLASRPANPTEE